MKRMTLLTLASLFSSAFLLFGCHANQATGDPRAAALGAGIGAGGAYLLGAPGQVVAMAGIGGGVVGYYVTTLHYQSKGVRQACGKVYKIGDYIGIYIPSDQLFESNTAEFTPQAGPILDSAAEVLSRYPDNNIMISGNTSGFARPRWEQALSQKRAERVAGYLWDAGITSFKERSIETRQLTYVGYGNYFPISSDLTNCGIRENSRIQITSFPAGTDIKDCKKSAENIGSMKCYKDGGC